MSDKPIRILSQAVMSVINEIGDFGPIKNVWQDRNGIANILSPSKMLEQGYRVKFDSMEGNHFMVDQGNGKLIVLDLSPEGLYSYKITKYPHYIFIETVTDNMEGFTLTQIKKATEARSAFEMVNLLDMSYTQLSSYDHRY